MKKSNVKRFDMGGYTAGMEGMGRLAAEKARRDEQIALDKADAIEEVHPEKYLIPGVAARRAVPAALRAGMDILKDEFMGKQTSEGLPTAQRLRDVRSRVAPGRLVRNKADTERIAGYRDQYKPGTSNTRNEQYRREAEEMGIPYEEYLKSRTAAEKGSMGLNPDQTSTNAMDQLRWKKGGVVPKGGKVGKVMGEFKSGSLKSGSGQKVTNRRQAMAIAMSEAGKSKMKKYSGKKGSEVYASGDVFSNYDVGEDPFLRSRQGGVWSLDEMKKGLTKKQIKNKTTPALTGDDDMSADLPKKKYAAGGKVKRMADGGMPIYGAIKGGISSSQLGNAALGALKGYGAGNNALPPRNPIDQMKQAVAASNVIKGAVARPPMAPDMKTPYPVKRPVTGNGPRMGIPPSVGAMPVYKKGGKVPKAKVSSAGEDAAYVKKEMAFMQKKGAPKSMMKHEKSEMNAGGMRKMAKGGGIERKGNNTVKRFAKGGSIDGCALRGRTRAKRG